MKIAENIIYFEEIDSTNAYAKEIAKQQQGNFVVWACRQSAGQGRLKRAWESPAGGLYFTMCFRADISPDKGPMLTLYTATAIYLALKQHGLEADIKWPNDIYVNGKKLAGILTEMIISGSQITVIIGVGLNIKAVSVPDAISLEQLDIKTDAENCMREIIAQCETVFKAYFNQQGDEYLTIYKNRLITKNKIVKAHLVNGTVEGMALGIDDIGRLLIQTAQGVIPVAAGDVTLKEKGL